MSFTCESVTTGADRLVSNEDNPQVVDLANFSEDHNLGDGLKLLIQLKGFNRKDRLARKNTQETMGALGSVESRHVSPGAIMVTNRLSSKTASLDDKDMELRIDTLDSRGLRKDSEGNILFACVNKVFRFHPSTNEMTQIPLESDWLAFIHSIDLSPDERRILITSSGFDRIIEFDAYSYNETFSWSAWTNGFNTSMLSGHMVKPPEDPKSVGGGLGLPPAERTAFPNSAIYDGEDGIITTMFHRGLARIDRLTGECRIIDQTLSHPHSAQALTKGGYMVTNTGSGEAKLYDEKFQTLKVLSFGNLPGLDLEANGREWLQQVKPVRGHDGFYIAVDSNRRSLFLVDTANELIKNINLQDNWVVQEVEVI